MTAFYITTAILGWLGFLWILYCRFQDVKRFRAAMNDRLTPVQIGEALTDEDRRLLAYHEAGHAVVSMYMPEREPLLKISIIPSEMGVGTTQTRPRMRFNETFVSMSSDVAVLLAGRLSEQMFCNEITTSAYKDFMQANQIARAMVTRFGMGTQSGFFIADEQVSEAFRRQVDEDVMEILNNAQKEASKILKEYAQDVHRIAKELLEKETIDIKT